VNALTSSTLIQRVLYGNAVFSGMGGLLSVFASNPIAKLIGINAPLVILLIGIGLTGYAALIYTNVSRAQISRSFILATVMSDSAWVLLSILLLTTGWVSISIAGKWSVGIIAVIVDVFATLQFLEWRKM